MSCATNSTGPAGAAPRSDTTTADATATNASSLNFIAADYRTGTNSGFGIRDSELGIWDSGFGIWDLRITPSHRGSVTAVHANPESRIPNPGHRLAREARRPSSERSSSRPAA